MKRILSLPLFIIAIAILFSSCKKEEELLDPSYKCECGSFNWQGSSFFLNDASRIEFIDTTDFSRKYFATAELRMGDQFLEPNSLNMMMEFQDISSLIFFHELDTLDTWDMTLQEVNYNDPLTVLREFKPEEGLVTITPAFPGSVEKVNFNFTVRQVVNGQFVGFPIAFSGSLQTR